MCLACLDRWDGPEREMLVSMAPAANPDTNQFIKRMLLPHLPALETFVRFVNHQAQLKMSARGYADSSFHYSTMVEFMDDLRREARKL